MSELKVYRDPQEGPCWREFYEKSEVDQVIAEKDEDIRRLKRALYKACAKWATLMMNKETQQMTELRERFIRQGGNKMKCDELKPLVFSLNDLAYVDELAVDYLFGGDK